VDLVHRKTWDRMVSAFYKVHRYECRSEACDWEGVLRSTHRRASKKGKAMKPWMWLVVIAVAIAAAVAMVAYLDTRPSGETTLEGPPTP
jgi:hypothetical protein